MTLKAGDKVKCIDNKFLEDYFNVDETYVVVECAHGGHVRFAHTGYAMWHSDRFELIEKEADVKEIKQFNPQPGDKIICNNGEEFTCCTKEFLLSKEITGARHFEIHAYRDDPNSEFINITWMGWLSDGKASGDKGYNIREVIHQASQDDTEYTKYKGEITRKVNGSLDLKMPNTYTAEDIRSAFIDDLGWLEESLEAFMQSLKKVKSPEYKEYLRLKDVFEGAE